MANYLELKLATNFDDQLPTDQNVIIRTDTILLVQSLRNEDKKVLIRTTAGKFVVEGSYDAVKTKLGEVLSLSS